MNKHIAVVHQYPAAFALTFNGNGQAVVLFLDGEAHTVCQRFNLAVAVAGADDEKVSDNGVGAKVEQNDIFCFFTLNGVDDVVGKF